MLNRFQMLLYEKELQYTLNTALYRFALLKKAGAAVLELQDRNRTAGLRDGKVFEAQGKGQGTAQCELRDTLEAFLTDFSRVSLLLFPNGESDFTKARGETMRKCLKLDRNSPLLDRALRNSWMHHDERLDVEVEEGRAASAYHFTRSDEDPDGKLDSALRVIVIDTLVVHFRDKNGNKACTDLKRIAEALAEVEKARASNPFDDLPHPPEGGDA